jgi:hypothetical protein
MLALVPLTILNGSCKSRNSMKVAHVKNAGGLAEASNLSPACADACRDVTSDENWATCYSCRCKAAMDGWLPSPAEVSCNAAREIPVYQARDTPEGITLEKISGAVAECFNPPRLPDARRYGGGCFPGSKLGQLQRGSIWAKWVCRREKNSGKFFDPQHNYDDHGLILFNERNGATCFFDDTDGVTNDNNNPDIDLTSGDTGKVKAFLGTYYRQEGGSCIGCHDNDPFMYSPYLKGADWQSSPSYTLGKYFAVHTGQEEQSHVRYLTSEKAAPCLMCHRIGQGNTCGKFVGDSAGNPEIESLQSWIRGNPGAKPSRPARWGLARDPHGHTWSTPAWMPPDMDEEQVTEKAWNDEYREAIETIESCCENPKAAGCEWSTL